MTTPVLGRSPDISLSYKKQLQEHTRARVFAYLKNCPKDKTKFVYQADLLASFKGQKDRAAEALLTLFQP